MQLCTDAISVALAPHPEAGLVAVPPPIHRLPRLSSVLKREIYILRDDLIGFALGGNKVRKLDFLVGDALREGVDTFVTSHATSFSRNAAAAGKAFGFQVHIVLAEDGSSQNPASQAFFRQMDARLHPVPGSPERIQESCSRLAESLRAEGRIVCELPPGGSTTLGALGYVRAFQQVARYSEAKGVRFAKIFHATGSCGTQAGLVLGRCLSGYPTDVIGVAISREAEVQHRRVLELAASTARELGCPFDPEAIRIDGRFLGDGYARPTRAGEDALKLFASREGILMDPVYAGKAAAGMIHGAEHAEWDTQDAVLFVHTGGNAGLYY